MRNIRQISPNLTSIPKQKRTAAYARVSSGKDGMLHSLTAQISFYSEYIQRRADWLFAGVYADEALTGTGDERPEFQRLLADCRAGKIDIIITKSITRFARNTLILLETVRELKALNIDIWFQKENILVGPPESRTALRGEEQTRNGEPFAVGESDEWRALRRSGDGELMLSILASFAQEESRSVSENCKWRIRKKFEEGVPNNNNILGYRLVDDTFHIVPEEADTVRTIFADFLSGMGKIAIAKKLTAGKIPTRRGGVHWCESAIYKILHNEKYTGNMLLQKTYIADHISKKKKMNRGELTMYHVEGSHEAIIDQETFDRVQTELARRAAQYGSAKKPPASYPFTGKIVCNICGKNYRRKTANAGSKYAKAVWICGTFNSHGRAACPSKQVPENILLEAAASILGIAEFDADIFETQIEQIQVPEPGKLVFVLRDGRRIETTWENPSRRDSWDKAAKIQQSKIMKERSKK